MNFRYPSLLMLLASLSGCGDTGIPSSERDNEASSQQSESTQDAPSAKENRADPQRPEEGQDVSSSEDDGASTESPWEITMETDPMTDAIVSKAEQVIVTPRGSQVVVAIACGQDSDGANKTGIYEITAYDEYGEGKVFSQRVSSSLFGGSSVVTDFKVRADKEDPDSLSFSVDYHNQIKFSQKAIDSDSEKQYWIKDRKECFQNYEFTNRLKAESLVVSLPFADGEEYLEIDQTDREFREFGNQCRYGDTALQSQYYVLMGEPPAAAYYEPCESRKYQLDTLPTGLANDGENAFYVPSGG